MVVSVDKCIIILLWYLQIHNRKVMDVLQNVCMWTTYDRTIVWFIKHWYSINVLSAITTIFHTFRTTNTTFPNSIKTCLMINSCDPELFAIVKVIN